MKNNELLRYDGSIVRVLDLRDDQALVIDCVKRHMPSWVSAAPLEECERTDISELCSAAGIRLRSLDSLSPTDRKTCRERYSIIAPVLPFVGDERRRTEMIYESADRFSISKQTIRKYLCLYLAYQNEEIFAPPENCEKPLTKNEKNMRWALNKYYYTRHRNPLTVAYQYMLQEKYTVDGVVTDNGREYVSAIFDQLADLGVSLVNLPPFRPELKGVCEKCFDLLQSSYKPYLRGKGVIEPDFQKRGARDYRLDACLILEEFDRVILRCITAPPINT